MLWETVLPITRIGLKNLEKASEVGIPEPLSQTLWVQFEILGDVAKGCKLATINKRWVSSGDLTHILWSDSTTLYFQNC